MTSVMRPPPPANKPGGNGTVARAPAKTFGRQSGVTRAANRVMIYGTGGIGKSSLAAMAPAPIFADLEGGTRNYPVDRVTGVENWSDLRSWLNTGDFTDVKSIVIDTVTTAEEWCRQYVIANVKTEKGQSVTSLEGFGWGKGYTHLFEEWRRLLADLERHYNEGRNVVLVAHEQIGNVPNPNGDDYIRYQPRLFVNKQVSILATTKEWCDEVWFVNYDVAAKDGKAKGGGSRSIYSVEDATHMAKTRSLDGQPIIFARGDKAVWDKLAGKPASAGDDMPV